MTAVLSRIRLASLCVFMSLAGACSRPAAPVATIAVTVAASAVESGAPVDVQYRFERLPGAPALPAGAWVFVHAIDAAGTLLWTDDHRPPTPASEWTGAPVSYTRTMFVPRVGYVGAVRIEAGLFVPEGGERVALDGDQPGEPAYQAASFELRPPANETFVVFGDGWYGAERAEGDAARSWRWSSGLARLSFRNPGRDVELWLEIDQPVTQAGAQAVEVRRGDETLTSLAVTPGERRVYRVPLRAASLGDAPVVELMLRVHPTFSPAAIAALASGDARELGVRLFNVHLAAR
jgi:hypothetical protein